MIFRLKKVGIQPTPQSTLKVPQVKAGFQPADLNTAAAP